MLVDCEGIVEEAIMLGAPVTGSADDWHHLARVVSGRIVNGYSRYIRTYIYCFVAAISWIITDTQISNQTKREHTQ